MRKVPPTFSQFPPRIPRWARTSSRKKRDGTPKQPFSLLPFPRKIPNECNQTSPPKREEKRGKLKPPKHTWAASTEAPGARTSVGSRQSSHLIQSKS
eukprot:832113-Amorphochlora_amoeboformis.AAC.1